jgi:uncharacterized protein YdhG (YjbR/CyaY superfamily)
VTKQFATIEDYIASYPTDVQVILEEVRRTIRNVVPMAGETVSYQIPTITLDGKYLVHFAAWKNHRSLYPTPTGGQSFEEAIAPYRAAKSDDGAAGVHQDHRFGEPREQDPAHYHRQAEKPLQEAQAKER